MLKNDFLQLLEQALEGEVPPSVIRENLLYYNSYIDEEVKLGKDQEQVIDSIGDPRLIARTIIDATLGPDYEEGEYQSYGGYEQQEDAPQGRVHYYDLNKWYVKLLAILILIAIVLIMLTVISGLFVLASYLIVPVGIAMIILWMFRGLRR